MSQESTRPFRPNALSILRSRWAEGKFMCVGLDSGYDELPKQLQTATESRANAVRAFNSAIVNTTHMSVCAYKPNIAFYPKELRAILQETFEMIREKAPGVLRILDFKRGDIGNTNKGYVVEAFDEFDPDAVTLHPYFGGESLEPFIKSYPDKLFFILCRTSNEGAKEFQDRLIRVKIDELKELMPHTWTGDLLHGWEKMDLVNHLIPQYQFVALRVAKHWNEHNNCALVVGATAPQELAAIRYLVGDMPILAPGVGKQNADLESALSAGLTSPAGGLVINASSSIIFAYKKMSDKTFDEAAASELARLNDIIKNHRQGR